MIAYSLMRSGFCFRRLASTASAVLLLVASAAVFDVTFSDAQAAEKGQITAITTDKSTVNRGETLNVTVTVQSLQRGDHHQLVVVNLLDDDGNAIYDSHVVGEDIDFVLGHRGTKEVGPFQITIPRSVRPGSYIVMVGYREYPWEPLIAFQGDKWNPPETRINIR